MHSLSAEMSVKTSLYLVFTAFIFSASVQVINFSKDLSTPCGATAIKLCSISAGFSLLAGTMLLVAAMVRQYKIFPTREMVEWVRRTEQYREEYPETAAEELAKSGSPPGIAFSEGASPEMAAGAANRVRYGWNRA